MNSTNSCNTCKERDTRTFSSSPNGICLQRGSACHADETGHSVHSSRTGHSLCSEAVPPCTVRAVPTSVPRAHAPQRPRRVRTRAVYPVCAQGNSACHDGHAGHTFTRKAQGPESTWRHGTTLTPPCRSSVDDPVPSRMPMGSSHRGFHNPHHGHPVGVKVQLRNRKKPFA